MKLITINTYPALGAAEMAKARLEDAGIPCVLDGRDQAGLGTFWSSANPVKLRVPADRADLARTLLHDSGEKMG